MASGPLVVKLEIKADGTAAIVGLNKVQGALDTTGKKGKEASAGINSLSSSLKGLALTAGAALSVGALASSFTAANRQAGLLRASLETVTGSVAKATTAWEVLQGFAAKTPYSLEQAVQGFIKLKAMGLDPSIAALTSYGNTAGAMGKSLNQMIEAVADAATGEFERLKEFGIKAKIEKDQVVMTFQGATTSIANNAQAIEKYLLGIGNLQFAGGMERQAKTLEGSISNLGDAWDQFWVKLGDTGLTQGVIAVLNDVSSGIASLSEGMTEANDAAGVFGETIATTYNELKSGVWSDTTTAIMATAGAIGGAIGLMTALSAAVAIATGVWGAFTAVLLANPVTLAIAGIGALIGVLYTLRDETITIGQTTTTVGATVSAVWETTASYSEAVWNTFSSYVSGVFNSLPPVVSSAGNAVLSVWSATMSGLMSLTSGAVNYVMNLFRWIGQSAGVLAGEVAMSIESGFSFDRLKEGLSGAVQYTDMLGEANQRASAGIAAAGQEIAKKAGAIAADNLETELGSVITAAHADQQHKAAMAAKLHAFEQNNLAGAHGKSTAAAKAGGAANKAAAKEAKEYEKDLDALIKQFLPARDDAEKLAEATDLIAEAHAKGDLVGKDYTEMVKKVAEAYDTATNDAQKLIDKYDTEGAKARELAEDRAKLAAVLADGTLKVEGASKAMDKLTEAEKKNNSEADAWTEVWKNAVKRIDDTFANLWEDLFSGGKSALASLKKAITSWLAEVAHALLTKPLVVAITASMTGGAGTAGAAGTVGSAVSSVGSGVSSFGSLSNFASLASSIYSLGSSFVSGVGAGFASMFSGTAGTALSFAGAGMASGSMTGIATGIGVAMPYLLPVIAVAAGVLSKYFKDQEPRTGAYAATTHGGVGQLEDNIGVRGAFGLTFGVNDKGSANMDANELRPTFEGFAKVSEAMAQFYGAEVSAQVEATLKKISQEHYAKTGILNYAMDVNQAFDVAFTQIIDAAAATGDAVAVVMKAVVGDLSGTAETMAGQIEAAMNTTAAVIQVAKALEGTDSGKILELGTDLTANALRLVDYANAIKWTGETTAAALTRMGQYMTALNTALDLSGQTVDVTGQAFVDLARNLAYAADVAKIGIEGLMQLQAFYYEQFTSAEEKFTRNIKAAGKAISDGLKDLYDPELIKDREAFTDLLNGLDLTTESGRKLYVELLKLAPAFDAVFDGVESFMNWLRPQEQADRQRAQLEKLFQDWGMNLPDTKADLDALVASGALTAEQMAILGGYLDALSATFGELTDTVEDTTVRLEDIIREQQDLRSRLYATMGDDAMVTKLRRDEELAAALSDDNRDILRQIYLLEDLAKEEEARIALEAERIEAAKTAATAAHEAAMAALTAQRDAAAATLNILQSTLSIIQSALDGLRVGRALYAEQRDAAARQLAAWASSGRLPEAEPLQRVLATLGRSGEQDYATGNAFRAAQGATFANLLKLEAVGTIQVDWAKATVESLERQMTFAQEAHTEMMSAFDAQIVKLSSLELLTDAQRAALEELLARIEGYLVPEKGPAPLDGLAFSPTTGLVEMGSSRNAQEQELQAIKEELILLRQDMAAASTAQVIPIKEMATRLQKWDLDGLPESSASSGTALRVA